MLVNKYESTYITDFHVAEIKHLQALSNCFPKNKVSIIHARDFIELMYKFFVC